jgi:hypothetical protein
MTWIHIAGAFTGETHEYIPLLAIPAANGDQGPVADAVEYWMSTVVNGPELAHKMVSGEPDE